MEDSPRHNLNRVKKFPSMDQQDFNLINSQHRAPEPTSKRKQPEPLTSRDHPRQERGNSHASPLMKYSSFLNDERQHGHYFDAEQRYSALQRQDYAFKPQEKYNQYEEGHYDGPRFSNSPPAPNRMTSINININNL